jgi:hypothetical protein
MLKCLSAKRMRPELIPLATSLPTWCGARKSIMSNLAHLRDNDQRAVLAFVYRESRTRTRQIAYLSSTSGPTEAPTKRLNFIFPSRPSLST